MSKNQKSHGKPKEHFCKRCGNSFMSTAFAAGKFCKECKELINEHKAKNGYYKTAGGKSIYLHNGVEVLNNVMGKEIAGGW